MKIDARSSAISAFQAENNDFQAENNDCHIACPKITLNFHNSFIDFI